MIIVPRRKANIKEKNKKRKSDVVFPLLCLLSGSDVKEREECVVRLVPWREGRRKRERKEKRVTL